MTLIHNEFRALLRETWEQDTVIMNTMIHNQPSQSSLMVIRDSLHKGRAASCSDIYVSAANADEGSKKHSSPCPSGPPISLSIIPFLNITHYTLYVKKRLMILKTVDLNFFIPAQLNKSYKISSNISSSMYLDPKYEILSQLYPLQAQQY